MAERLQPTDDSDDEDFLAPFDAELDGRHLEDTVNVFGQSVKIQTLTPFQEEWAEGRAGQGAFGQVVKARALAYACCCIQAWGKKQPDGTWTYVPVENMKRFRVSREEQKKDLTPFERWGLVRRNIMLWMGEKHSPLAYRIKDAYDVLDNRRNEGLTALDPLPESTPPGP